MTVRNDALLPLALPGICSRLATSVAEWYLTTMKTHRKARLIVVASDSIKIQQSEAGRRRIYVSEDDRRCDALDDFNHTRLRRARILEVLLNLDSDASVSKDCSVDVEWAPAPGATGLDFYELVHSNGLLTFLRTAYEAWEQLGPQGWDPSGCLILPSTWQGESSGDPSFTRAPPLIPVNMPLARLRPSRQRPSRHVLGQVGYYCNDTCTPIFDQLPKELLDDAGVMERTLQLALQATRRSNTMQSTTIYAIPTHPGHHAAEDSFGGYCYVNHAAALAKQLQTALSAELGKSARIAILDVDYHCGNGTASIFDADPGVLVVSLHCDPDYDYPFHMGFADDDEDADCEPGPTGSLSAKTMHLPLPPHTSWSDYKTALEKALSHIQSEFQPQSLVVSLGLDTYAEDPCALRRAGFRLEGQDYVEMGELIGNYSLDIPSVIFVQEGGYRMDVVAKAATDVVASCQAARQGAPESD